jgi:hypothetical protein
MRTITFTISAKTANGVITLRRTKVRARGQMPGTGTLVHYQEDSGKLDVAVGQWVATYVVFGHKGTEYEITIKDGEDKIGGGHGVIMPVGEDAGLVGFEVKQ